MLGEKSEGDVLVVEGSAYLGRALMGDVIARKGANNGWAGVVIYGAIRDACAMRELDFGVKALGTNPRTSVKEGLGESDIIVSFGGVTFQPGYWIYCDDDGILVSREPYGQ
jgi:regulator of ribonuclease activity A